MYLMFSISLSSYSSYLKFIFWESLHEVSMKQYSKRFCIVISLSIIFIVKCQFDKL